MTLLQMKYFREIAEARSISTAAKTLGISQSALRITMDKLEMELGYFLFERQDKTILLLPYGKKYCTTVILFFIN